MRLLPLLIIIAALMVVIYFKLYEYISFKALEQHHAQLKIWTQSHYFLVALIYMLIYILVVALSIPGATIVTLVGGFLFGYVFGTIFVVVSATLGACIIFIAVKSAFGEWLAEKASGWVARMEAGFRKNAFNYLLFLRLVPLFPFWVVNIVPAVIGVRLRTFSLATLLGIIPGSFVYVSVGNGLGALLAEGKTPDLGIIFKPAILIPIVGLGILSLIPIIHQKIKARKHD